MERLSRWRPSQNDDRVCRRIHPALPDACAAEWLSSHPILRLPGEPLSQRESWPMPSSSRYVGAASRPNQRPRKTTGTRYQHSPATRYTNARSCREGRMLVIEILPRLLDCNSALSSIRREPALAPELATMGLAVASVRPKCCPFAGPGFLCSTRNRTGALSSSSFLSLGHLSRRRISSCSEILGGSIFRNQPNGLKPITRPFGQRFSPTHL